MLVLKNSVIDLTKSETRTLLGFSLLYSFLVLVILGVISFLYYQFQKDLMLQEKRQILQNYSNELVYNLKELKLLKFFLQHPNELLIHDRIYDYVWDYDEEYSDNSLRTYIKNLRKILGKDKIVSLKKLGYRFNQE